jgi:uncharacterized membrane protein YeiH
MKKEEEVSDEGANMQSEIFLAANIIGVFAFAFTGAMRAIKAGMDLLGILTLGIVTALGGGIFRDVLVNKIPYALLSNSDMATASIGVIIAALVVRTANKDISNTVFILIPDALGLAAFTSTGALIAYNAGLSVFGLVILATLTAVGGGILGDIFCCRTPSVLKDDFYATCAIAGALAFCLFLTYKVDLNIGSFLCSGVVFVMRIMAIYFKWRLPKIAYKPGNGFSG